MLRTLNIETKEEFMVVRWGIIGLGDIAERNFVPAVAEAAGAELVSVFSRSMEKAKAFTHRYKVARAYDSLDKMLADRELDAVYVASPNSIHADQSVAAARAGKHVLCDKPMALTVPDCERMIRATQENKVKLGVAFRLRYHPAHVEARRRVQTGVLGEMQLIKAQNFVGGARPYWKGWRRDPAITGSGSIVGQAVHPVDLLRYLTDSEITEVRCITDERPPDRPVDEITCSVFKFRNGALAHVASGALVPRSDNDAVLYGSNAKIFCRGTLGRNEKGKPQEVIVESDSPEIRLQYSDDTPVTRTSRLIEDFNKSITNHTETVISAENGLQMVRIANAMLESSKNGKTIRLE